MKLISQKLPPEEVGKVKFSPDKIVPNFIEWAKRWKNQIGDTTRFMKSVWDNPYNFDLEFHDQNAQRQKQKENPRKQTHGPKHKRSKPNWLQWANLTPKLRGLSRR